MVSTSCWRRLGTSELLARSRKPAREARSRSLTRCTRVQLDDPTSATNLDPYALTLTLHTNATRQRSGEGDQPLTAGVYDIQSGDTFFMESKIKSAFTYVFSCRFEAARGIVSGGKGSQTRGRLGEG